MKDAIWVRPELKMLVAKRVLSHRTAWILLLLELHSKSEKGCSESNAFLGRVSNSAERTIAHNLRRLNHKKLIQIKRGKGQRWIKVQWGEIESLAEKII